MLAVLLSQARTGQSTATPQTPAQQSPAQSTTTTQPTAAAQTPASPGSTAVASTAAAPNVPMMFVKAMTVPELGRLAITPNIDGKIDPEEWDPFSSDNGVDTYFQWEPQKLHFAASHVPIGQDLVISIDGHGDSWLVGRDNLEVRVHWNGNDAQLTERILDNTPVSGPVWVDAANFRSTTEFASSADASGHTIEMSIIDPDTGTFPDTSGKTVGIRFDEVPESTAPAEPLLPRVMTPAHLQLARGESIPAGLTWRAQVPERTVVPGQGAKIRLTFNGNDDLNLKRIDMRTEGLAQNNTFASGVPFPGFDKKGRAFVDYKTNVTPDAALGYRVMKATLVDGSGKTSVMETSYEIAPIISFDFHDRTVVASSEPTVASFTTILESHTTDRVDGVFRIQVPDGWKVKDGNDQRFMIYDSRGKDRITFKIMVPGGFKGTAPIKLISDFNGKHSESTEYIVVQ